MIRAIAATLLLLCCSAYGQCLPKSVFPGEKGTDYIFVATDQVEGRIGWCPETVTPAGTQWRMVVYQWSLKKYVTAPATLSPFAVLDQLRAASSPMAAASAIAAQLSIPVAAGSAEETYYRIWRWEACKKLTTPPFTLTPTPFDPFPVDYCGTRPADPGAPAERWIVTPSGSAAFRPAFAVVNGKRAGLADNEAATRAPCDCTTKFVELGGLVTYCLASPRTPTSVPHVTACVKQP